MTFTTVTGYTFTASVTSTGGALEFKAGIKYDDGGGITVVISVETPTPPFVDDPIPEPTPSTPTTPGTGGGSGGGGGGSGGGGSGSGSGSGSTPPSGGGTNNPASNAYAFTAGEIFGPFSGSKTIDQLLALYDLPPYATGKIQGMAVYLNEALTNEVSGSTSVTKTTTLYIYMEPEDTHGIDVSNWPQDDALNRGSFGYFIRSDDGKALAVNFMSRGNGKGTWIPTVYVLQDEGAGEFPIGTWTHDFSNGDVEKIIFNASKLTFDSPYADTWEYDYTVSSSNTFNLTNYREVPHTPTAEQQAQIAAFNETAFRASHPWIPATSTIGPLTASKTEIDYNIVDKINIEFETDSTVAVTTWVTFDYVDEIESFNPSVPAWTDIASSSWIKKLTFEADGDLIWNDNRTAKWTKDLLLMAFGDGDIAPKYEVESLSGTDYLFLENKSGDYTIRARKPGYFVMVQQQ
jgi:hypothetical protein